MLLDCTDRILVLDGAMGTVLQARFPGASNFETLNLTDPDAVQAVHEAYIAAGADIITTEAIEVLNGDLHMAYRTRRGLWPLRPPVSPEGLLTGPGARC